jgi:hypothetical protein
MRPHIAIAGLIGLALALVWTAPAEAGPRGRRAKKAQAQSRSQTHPRRRPAPTAAPAPGVAAKDGEPVPRARPASEASGAARKPADRPRGEKIFDFTGLELAGSERMPQLLYFLDRAEAELERASLERRSFVPAMMRSLDEEDL